MTPFRSPVTFAVIGQSAALFALPHQFLAATFYARSPRVKVLRGQLLEVVLCCSP